MLLKPHNPVMAFKRRNCGAPRSVLKVQLMGEGFYSFILYIMFLEQFCLRTCRLSSMSNSPKCRRLFPLCMLFKIPYYLNKLLLFQRANNIYFAFKLKVDNLKGWGEERLSPSPTADHQGAAKTLWPDLKVVHLYFLLK